MVAFKPLHKNNAHDIEAFVDMLDIAEENLKEAERYGELGSEPFYVQLQRKLPK